MFSLNLSMLITQVYNKRLHSEKCRHTALGYYGQILSVGFEYPFGSLQSNNREVFAVFIIQSKKQ